MGSAEQKHLSNLRVTVMDSEVKGSNTFGIGFIHVRPSQHEHLRSSQLPTTNRKVEGRKTRKRCLSVYVFPRACLIKIDFLASAFGTSVHQSTTTATLPPGPRVRPNLEQFLYQGSISCTCRMLERNPQPPFPLLRRRQVAHQIEYHVSGVVQDALLAVFVYRHPEFG